MIFIPVVLFSAIRHGLLPSLWATLLSTLAYNFFFLEPLYTLTIEDPQNVVALFFLLLVAVIASQLAAQSRAQAEAARRQAASTAALYGFSRKIAGIGNMDDLLWAVAHQIALMLKAHVVLLLPDGDDLIVRTGYPPEDELDEADLAAAKWSWSRGQVGGPLLRHAAGRQAPVPAAAHGARAGRRHGARPAAMRARCCRRTSGACWTRWPTRPRSRSSASRWPPASTRRG